LAGSGRISRTIGSIFFAPAFPFDQLLARSIFPFHPRPITFPAAMAFGAHADQEFHPNLREFRLSFLPFGFYFCLGRLNPIAPGALASSGQ
jgi:hypothetical protein